MNESRKFTNKNFPRHMNFPRCFSIVMTLKGNEKNFSICSVGNNGEQINFSCCLHFYVFICSFRVHLWFTSNRISTMRLEKYVCEFFTPSSPLFTSSSWGTRQFCCKHLMPFFFLSICFVHYLLSIFFEYCNEVRFAAK